MLDIRIPEDAEISSGLSSNLMKVPGPVFADLLSGAREDAVADRDYSERYSFQDVLGEGGQGVVVRARDLLLERDVAIKTLKNRQDPTLEGLLRREAKLCGRLEHPNILPTYDLAQDDLESPLFVMKKIEGRSLEELLGELRESGPDGLRRARLRLLNIFLQVLNAIDFSHSRGVLHLDLKPGNISLGKFGEVYVIDWGFAREKDSRSDAVAGGTVHYLAPERLDRKEFDERADIFSLGVMLYRLLTGRHPRDIGDLHYREYRKSWRDYPLVAPRERDRSIPPELEAIILKAMAEDSQVRYASAHAFADDLVRFMDMLPVAAYRESIFGQMRRFVRKHRRPVIAGSALLAMLIVTGLALWQQQATERRRERAERERMALVKRQAEAETERVLAINRRYAARRVLDRALDLFDKLRGAVEVAPDSAEKKKLFAPVLTLFKEAIQIDPKYAEAYERRGRAYQLVFDFDAALADYRMAFDLDPSYLMSLYEAGMLYSDVKKEPEKAREMFLKMEKYYPNDEYAKLGQARVDLAEADRFLKLKLGQEGYGQREGKAEELFDKTLERCRRIEQANSALSDIWYLRGLVYQKSPQRKDPKKALEAYNKYLASRRDSPSAFHNRGDARKDLDDFKGAVLDYTEALKINPDFIWSLRNRGYLLYRYLDQPQRALEDINRAITINPKDFWSYVDRGAVREGMGDQWLALEDYQQALSLAPENPQVLYRLGVAQMYLQDPAAAETSFSRAVQRDPDEENPLLLYRRGLARLAQEKYADAVSDFESALRQDPESRAALKLLRFVALKMSGMPVGPDELGRDFVPPAQKPWLAALGSFYLGEARLPDVLQAAGDPFAESESKGRLYIGLAEQKAKLAQAPDLNAVCEARFYCGLKALSSHELEEAARNFQAAVDTDRRLLLEHAISVLFLKKLNSQPTFGR